MKDEDTNFFNVYKLFKNSSLKYGSFGFSFDINNEKMIFIFKNGEIISKKINKSGEVKIEKSSKNGFDIIGFIYKDPKLREKIKNLFLKAITDNYKDNSIYIEYDVAEISDLVVNKKSYISFQLDIKKVKTDFVIDHMETEAFYRINGKEVSFYDFTNTLNKDYIGFKLAKNNLIKSLTSKSNNSNTGMIKRNYENLIIKFEENGREFVDIDKSLKAISEAQSKKN